MFSKLRMVDGGKHRTIHCCSVAAPSNGSIRDIAMTAARFLPPGDAHAGKKYRIAPPHPSQLVKHTSADVNPPVSTTSRKRPRPSSSSSVSPACSPSTSPRLRPPNPPVGAGDNSDSRTELCFSLSRPQASPPSKNFRCSSGNNAQEFPFVGGGKRYADGHAIGPPAPGGARSKFPGLQARMIVAGKENRGGDGYDGREELQKEVSGEVKLSKAAMLLEEDKKKVAAIRSFLLNFLEERDCSIKKRLVSMIVGVVWGRRCLLAIWAPAALVYRVALRWKHAILCTSFSV